MISAVTISLFLFERAVEPIQLLKTFVTLQISYHQEYLIYVIIMKSQTLIKLSGSICFCYMSG